MSMEEEEEASLDPSLDLTRVRSILSGDPEDLAGRKVAVAGWVKTGREQGKGTFVFLELNDGSCMGNLQVIVDASVHALAPLVATGTSVVLEGELKKPPVRAKQKLEMRADRVLHVGPVDPARYPIPKTKLTLEFLRDFVHLRARTNTKKRSEEPKLSKSKQRKLRRIQEEKERKAKLAESLELLEKHRLRDSVRCLLRSSGTIGQAQTMREKRLLEAQLAKVGLEIPEDVPLAKRGRVGCDYADGVEDPEPRSPISNPLIDASCMNEHRVPEEGMQDHAAHETVETGIKDVESKQPMLPQFEQAQCSNVNDTTSNSMAMPSESTMPNNDAFPSKEQDKPRDDSNASLITAPNTSASIENSVKVPTVVHISRSKEAEEQRSSLPIVMMEQEIMESVNENSAVIICGETGCGKTTQVPQFLYEAGFGSNSSPVKRGIIGITQPRRVAVLATAKRVAHELGLSLGKEVGFQVRHDKMLGEKCSIKFMTDGILLRELQGDFLLKKYSVIILDEAHERSLNTDILIGMLSRIIRLRQKIYLEQQVKIISGVKIKPEDTIGQLKLVLMSATLRVEDFISDRRLFQEPPPVIKVPTRQFPVTTHFSKRTDLVDYVGQAYKKVMRIHKRLPPGGILVFLTGQREIEYLCKKLRRASQQLTKNNVKKKDVTREGIEDERLIEINGSFDKKTNIFDTYDQDEDDPQKDITSSSDNESEVPADSESSDEDFEHSTSPQNTDSVLEFIKEPETLASLKASFDALYGSKDRETSEEKTNITSLSIKRCSTKNSFPSAGALRVLPLYARLPASEQLHVFDNVREGERLVVVATNVAETSLTIPGIWYVVDTGREKVRNYNHANGMETYEVQWISKASAAQRTGRAGRTAPGHCYRLYSSAVFSNIFSEFPCPQISKIPVDGVILFMKYLGISKVVQFPFPTRPDSTAVLEAERCLKVLEALDDEGRLTSIGRVMAQFPMSPRHSRMLLTVVHFVGTQQDFARANLVLGYAVAAAAALSFPNPLNVQLEESPGATDDLDYDKNSDVHKEERKKQKKRRAVAKEACEKFCNPTSDALSISHALQIFELAEKPLEFCKSKSLHYKTMDDMSKLRKQLLQLIFTYSKSLQQFTWNHGSAKDVEDVWRVPSDKHPLLINEEEILAQAICAGWADRVAKRVRKASELSEMDQKARAVRYESCAVNETVYLHRWSMVARAAPEFLVYTELCRTKRPYMHGVTSVKSDWLVKYGTSLCSFSAPLTNPKPYYEPMTDELLCWVSPTFGPHLWELPLHRVPIKNNDQRVSIFACALLEGNVLPCMKSTQQFMAALPSLVLKPEAVGQKRVGDLLSRLKKGPIVIDTRASLREAWKYNPQALYPEIRCWFQEKFRSKFEEFWRRMHEEVELEPHELFPKRTRKTKKPCR